MCTFRSPAAPLGPLAALQRLADCLGADHAALCSLFAPIGLFIAACTVSAGIIPPDRLPVNDAFPWKAGIPGGIPTNYSVFCNVRESIPGTNIVAIGDGLTDDGPALQAALDRCPNGMVVYIPAGTYALSNKLVVTATYPGSYQQAWRSVIIRGAGPGNTILKGYNGDGEIMLFTATGRGAVKAQLTNSTFRGTFGIPAGGTRLPIASTNHWVSNTVCYIYMPNDTNWTTVLPGLNYFRDLVSQMNRVVGTEGADLMLERPLYSARYSVPVEWQGTATNQDLPYTNAWVFMLPSVPYRCGVEDLTVDRPIYRGTHNIYFKFGYQCWVKGVQSLHSVNWHITFDQCFQCEAQHSECKYTWYGGGNSGYGFFIYNGSTDCLVEDNIAVNLRHSYITQGGCQGNVFGYNCSVDPINGDKIDAYFPNHGVGQTFDALYSKQLLTDFLMIDACHHGGDPRFNLWEGNIVAHWGADNTGGSSRWNTVFRNWSTGKGLPTVNAGCAVEVQANNVSNSILGNVFLTPGQACSSYDFTNGVSRYSVRRFGNWSSGDTNKQSLDIYTNTIYHRNWDYTYQANWPDPLMPDEPLPPSFYLREKPAWWPAAKPWPCIGSDLPFRATNNPAMDRYVEFAGPRNLRVMH